MKKMNIILVPVLFFALFGAVDAAEKKRPELSPSRAATDVQGRLWVRPLPTVGI